jgi:hypothetical protein
MYDFYFIFMDFISAWKNKTRQFCDIEDLATFPN